MFSKPSDAGKVEVVVAVETALLKVSFVGLASPANVTFEKMLFVPIFERTAEKLTVSVPPGAIAVVFVNVAAYVFAPVMEKKIEAAPAAIVVEVPAFEITTPIFCVVLKQEDAGRTKSETAASVALTCANLIAGLKAEVLLRDVVPTTGAVVPL